VNKSYKPCVLFFVKYPKRGQVKKRLALKLGEDVVVELYRNFVLDSLLTLEECGIQFLVCFYPPNSKEKFVNWLGRKYLYLPQKGSDLGRRMRNSFISAFNNNFNRVVTLGSDIPDLPSNFIKDAFLALETHEVVIGPSFDGGYYLIGFRKDTFLPEAFDGINWGTQSVFQETLTVLQGAGYKIHIHPKWSDIDTYADLNHLVERNQNTEFRYSRTFSCLFKNSRLLR
jgi:rSAM/selenodomain-associated transferase 1